MSAPIKYLNIEDLETPTQRALMLKGVEHPILEQSVDMFIAQQLLIREMEKLKVDDVNNMGFLVETTVKLILLSVPTLKSEVLRSLPLAALNTISSFVRGDEEVPVEAEVQSDPSKK